MNRKECKGFYMINSLRTLLIYNPSPTLPLSLREGGNYLTYNELYPPPLE
jgi:hypothetical protein